MKPKLIVTLFLIVFSLDVTAQIKISSKEVLKHIGEMVKMRDSVYEIRSNKINRTIQLELGGSYPHQSVSLVINQKDLKKFKYNPLIYFENKTVFIVGTIILQKGNPLILVTTPTQLTLDSSNNFGHLGSHSSSVLKKKVKSKFHESEKYGDDSLAFRFFKEHWIEIFIHLLCEVVLVGGGILLIQQIRYFIKLRCKFHERSFDIFTKGGEKGEPLLKAQCTVRGNKIRYKGHGFKDEKFTFNGEFIINILNLRTGEGYQVHDTFEGFNFPKMLIRDDNSFLVQTSYVGFDHEIHHQAFIWKKVPKKGITPKSN